MCVKTTKFYFYMPSKLVHSCCHYYISSFAFSAHHEVSKQHTVSHAVIMLELDLLD